MKRITIAATISIITLSLTACSSTAGPDMGSWARWTSFKSLGGGGSQVRTAQYEQLKGNGQNGYYPKTYKAPRKYYITKQDQQSYQNMNNKIEQRMQTQQPTGVQGSSSGNGMMLPQHNAPANTNTNQTVPFPAPQ